MEERGMRFGFLIAALATIPVAHGYGQTQTTPTSSPPPAHSLANAYRGAFVCEKAPGAADILHVPVDLAVRGDEVQFARPLFDLRRTRVVGNELGAGSVDAGGNVHLSSTWEFGGIVVRSDYSGTLGANGGTLTGTQSWRGAEGSTRSRTCQIALVRAANAKPAAKQ
jgi:hypothetical protein